MSQVFSPDTAHERSGIVRQAETACDTVCLDIISRLASGLPNGSTKDGKVNVSRSNPGAVDVTLWERLPFEDPEVRRSIKIQKEANKITGITDAYDRVPEIRSYPPKPDARSLSLGKTVFKLWQIKRKLSKHGA